MSQELPAIATADCKMVAPDDDTDDPEEARPSARHFARTNFGFFDGHDKALRLDQFYGISNGVGVKFTANQTPPDLFFCPDPTNPSTCAITH
jgi:prepilin-type processing-associated H-X9-DG protein